MPNSCSHAQHALACGALVGASEVAAIFEVAPLPPRKKLCTGCPFGVVDWVLLGAKRANQWSTDSQKWPPPPPAAVIPDPPRLRAYVAPLDGRDPIDGHPFQLRGAAAIVSASKKCGHANLFTPLGSGTTAKLRGFSPRYQTSHIVA